MNCKNCGNQIILEEKFCRICGEPVLEQQMNKSIEILPSPIDQNIDQQNSNVMCKLILHRKRAFFGSMVPLDVYIDSEKVGTIKNGKTLELDIFVGQHSIYFCRNNAFVSFNARNNIYFLIKGDTTVDVIILGPNNVGLTNINGQGNKYIYN